MFDENEKKEFNEMMETVINLLKKTVKVFYEKDMIKVVAKGTKDLFNEYKTQGFTEDQAMRLILNYGKSVSESLKGTGKSS